MATKLYYAIDYRRMHTGIHGLLIFEDRVSAEKSMALIQGILREVDMLDRRDASETERNALNQRYDRVMQQVFDAADFVQDEINYRDIIWAQKYNKNVKEYKYKLNGRTIRVINTSVDLYV